ncbi:hypothetical protein D5086_030662, partial [Populus alba]
MPARDGGVWTSPLDVPLLPFSVSWCRRLKTVVRLYDGAGSNRCGATPQHVQNCDSCASWGLLATRVRAKTKNLITLAGLRPEATSLTWNNSSTKIDDHQASRVIETGNFRCGTVIVGGEDFITETITFEKFSPE